MVQALCTVRSTSNLLPFFKNNPRFELLETCSLGFPTSLSIAIDASTLRSIKFLPDSEFDWSNSNLDGLIIQSLIEKSGLCHLNLYECILSKTACHALSVVLADKNCTVQSLFLTTPEENNQEMDINIIISGLAQNESVKCLKILSGNALDAEFSLRDFQCVSLRSLEKLHLELNDEGRIDVAQLIKRIPNLKCLVLENVKLDSMLGPTLSLQDLHVDGASICDEQLLVLADSLKSTASLKKLCIEDSYTVHSNITSVGWCAFFDSISGLVNWLHV
jgi:hypothetical protein